MALANPSIWSSIRATLKTVKDRFNKWKENRQQRKKATRQRHDNENISNAEDLISKKTARESFAEKIQVSSDVQQNIANKVQEVLDEKGQEPVATREEEQEQK